MTSIRSARSVLANYEAILERFDTDVIAAKPDLSSGTNSVIRDDKLSAICARGNRETGNCNLRAMRRRKFITLVGGVSGIIRIYIAFILGSLPYTPCQQR